MTDSDKGFENQEELTNTYSSTAKSPEKGPLSFFSGALTSGILSWLCFLISKKIVYYFVKHDIDYTSPIAQSVASGFKTLIIGISFLATFSFGFIGLGLTIVFVKSLFDVKKPLEH